MIIRHPGNYLTLFCIISLTAILFGCNTESECCDPENLITADVYGVEYYNLSRFICVSGISGEKMNSKYLYTAHIHVYESEKFRTHIEYMHNLVKEDWSIENRPNAISKSIDFSFGRLFIQVEHMNAIDMGDTTALVKAINAIKLEEKSQQDICFYAKTQKLEIPHSLIEIGAYEFYSNKNRNTLLIQVDDPLERSLLEKLYDNRDTLKSHLKDGDLIIFTLKEEEQPALRTYLIVDSEFEEDQGWCGMGPQNFSFETIYLDTMYYELGARFPE